ncbi:hypothetical protein PBI_KEZIACHARLES14_8 [Mycobacterium phage Keziacharles14]|nr:hypothetical protein PBI_KEZIACHARLES14_8 [Mycobacterium phage Keziacharles14]
MKAKIAQFLISFALKRIVKYCLKHPDFIPGDLDDRWMPIVAKALGI